MNTTQLRTLAHELTRLKYHELLLDKNYGAVSDMLNEQEIVDNPDPQGTRPVPITWSEFVGLITDGEAIDIYAYDALVQDIKEALASNDRVFLGVLWNIIKAGLSPESRAAIIAAMQNEEDDPDWQETIAMPSTAQTLGLPYVTENDVLRAIQLWQ